MPRFRSTSCVLLTTIVWTACLLPASLLAAPASMPAFSATYSVRYGLLRGSMTLQLEPRGSGYVYTTALRPRGVASLIRRGEIRESTNLIPGEGLVRPLDYSSVDTIAKPARHARYGFDSSTGRVTGPHLDWRMNWRKQRVDPQQLVGPQPAVESKSSGDKANQ